MWWFNGLFHIFATASPVGAPHPNKLNEDIGWAVSTDGIHFTEHPANPVAPWTETTPLTTAMSEGHVWFDEKDELIYVYHTIRWTTNAKSAFAPSARNNEDLGVEVLTRDPKFTAGRTPPLSNRQSAREH